MNVCFPICLARYISACDAYMTCKKKPKKQ